MNAVVINPVTDIDWNRLFHWWNEEIVAVVATEGWTKVDNTIMVQDYQIDVPELGEWVKQHDVPESVLQDLGIEQEDGMPLPIGDDTKWRAWLREGVKSRVLRALDIYKQLDANRVPYHMVPIIEADIQEEAALDLIVLNSGGRL